MEKVTDVDEHNKISRQGDVTKKRKRFLCLRALFRINWKDAIDCRKRKKKKKCVKREKEIYLTTRTID